MILQGPTGRAARKLLKVLVHFVNFKIFWNSEALNEKLSSSGNHGSTNIFVDENLRRVPMTLDPEYLDDLRSSFCQKT